MTRKGILCFKYASMMICIHVVVFPKPGMPATIVCKFKLFKEIFSSEILRSIPSYKFPRLIDSSLIAGVDRENLAKLRIGKPGISFTGICANMDNSLEFKQVLKKLNIVPIGCEALLLLKWIFIRLPLSMASLIKLVSPLSSLIGSKYVLSPLHKLFKAPVTLFRVSLVLAATYTAVFHQPFPFADCSLAMCKFNNCSTASACASNISEVEESDKFSPVEIFVVGVLSLSCLLYTSDAA